MWQNAYPGSGRLDLLLRADAGRAIGTGHVMRCLALAQACQGAGRGVALATAAETPALEARLRSEGVEVVRLSALAGSADDAAETAALARRLGAPWVGLDGYHYAADFRRQLKDAGLALLVIDDLGMNGPSHADVVLNQNLYADAGLYPGCEATTRLLLGTRYALLRREFLAWQPWQRRTAERAAKVLVTLGGSDPENATLKVVQALRRLDHLDLEAQILVGAASPHAARLKEALPPSGRLRLLTDAANMPELMAWADVAVSAGGSTCWELAYLGLPNVVLVLAENQRRVAEGLEARGVAVNLGHHAAVSDRELADALGALIGDPRRRQAMNERGRQIVDGRGAERVLSALKEVRQ